MEQNEINQRVKPDETKMIRMCGIEINIKNNDERVREITIFIK